MLKLTMATTDFMTITNGPQPLIQFIAEIGGLLAFFLGSSAITLMECCCYGASKVRREYLEREKMRRVGGVESSSQEREEGSSSDPTFSIDSPQYQMNKF